MMWRRVNLNIGGMTCQACANRIEKVLNKKDFIQSADVNFAGETALVVFDETQVSLDNIVEIIEKTGFQAALSAQKLPETGDSSWQVWALLGLALPFAVGMLGMLAGTHGWMPPMWIQVALASVAQGYFALPFYRGAVASVRAGLANMDVLVSLGTLAIYVYSLVMVFRDSHEVYFEAGVMVLAFVALGKYAETRTKRGSLNALTALLQCTPPEVLAQRDGQWQRVPIHQVQVGDVLRCVEGGRIGADGVVVAGEGWADERHLTGESVAVHKTVGDTVLAGSMFSGSVDYRAQHLGRDTLLGDMMAALADAQGSKAPMARLADKVAAVFVPMVLVVAILSLMINWLILGQLDVAVMRGVAVLVVACPCALGLATPAAIMAGMGVAVRRGVWFKNAQALEHAHAVNAIVLDKTGTLTHGKPEMVAIWTAAEIDETELFAIAAAVEAHSAHPLAKTIVAAAEQRGITPRIARNVQTITGQGIIAEIDGIGEIHIGKAQDFRLPEQAIWRNASIVAVTVNGQTMGAFALADALKPNSIAAVQQWHQQGIAVYLLSGDRESAVAHITEQLHLSPEHAHGNQSPRQKAEFIQQLQRQGAIVAMVGDGINDAPALAQANVGFAVRGSTDVAEYSADAVLVRPSMQALADGLQVSRATIRTIRQNLFFAFFYNVLGIPLAAMGWLNPVLAGAMMAMSSLSVLANALRLTRMNR